MNENLHILSSEVLDLSDFDASFVSCLLDAFAEAIDRLAVREFGDGNGFAITLFHQCAHLDSSTTKSIIIARNVDETTGLEVGIEGEILTFQVGNGSLAEFAKVVGQNFCTQSHRNTFCSLCQKKGELHGQGNWFFVTSVVGEFPLSGFRIEQHIEGKLGESSFDVTRSRSLISREDISPRTLAIDEEILTSHLGESIYDRGITMRVKFHGFTSNVCHLVVATIVHALHGVKDAALHRFETIVEMRHSTLQNYIGSIV